MARKATISNAAKDLRTEMLSLCISEPGIQTQELAERLGKDRTHLATIRNEAGFRAAVDAGLMERAAKRTKAKEAREARAWALLDQASEGEKLTEHQWRFVEYVLPKPKAEMGIEHSGAVKVDASPESIDALVAALKEGKAA